MAAQLAIGTTAANSADFTVVTALPKTLFLTGTSGALSADATIELQIKSAAGDYYPVNTLNITKRILFLEAPGVYRVARLAGPSVGVELL